MEIKTTFQNMVKRFEASNNRTLATFFGALCGLTVGIIVLVTHSHNFPLVGHAVSLPFQIIGILLAMGTGANLSSYIGACVDLVTNECTVVDLVKVIYEKCKGTPLTEKKITGATEQLSKSKGILGSKQPFPFINPQDVVTNTSSALQNISEEANIQKLQQSHSSTSNILHRLIPDERQLFVRLLQTNYEQQEIIEKLQEHYLEAEQIIEQLKTENSQLKTQISQHQNTQVYETHHQLQNQCVIS